MATIIRGSGIPALSGNATTDDVAKGKTFYNTDATELRTGTRTQTQTYTFGSNAGGTVDLGELNRYRYANAANVYNYGYNTGYNKGKTDGTNAAHSAIGTCKRSEVTTAYGYDGTGSVIDTGNSTRRKAVLVGGGHSGSGRDGGCEASNNNSSWTRISTGFYTYRYYRAWSQTTDDSSSISYGFCGVLDLGY